MKKAQEAYQRTIEHAESEHPKQMLHSQSRVPQLAKIGLALLYLGCRESVDISRLGFSKVSLDDLTKAKNVIAVLDKGGTVCNVSEFLLMMTKTCLHYRLGSYQRAYDLAQEAKAFATEHSFVGYLDFADRTVQFLQNYV
ncbi:Hypp2709 [Branchiostoma lanceolatum]|uniref:Hypp2709 protein n=1 Tax=Branchiostoma lanceolatum TaxID=7740 RepID=A0A8J9ZTS4_BRALA|nr:Hypp2709 [Branchiostoma lanceolatum]